MARYRVAIGARAEADLMAIPFPHRRAINQKILSLRREPRPKDWEQVGSGGDAALIVHGYELLYSIDDDALSVSIVAILPASV